MTLKLGSGNEPAQDAAGDRRGGDRDGDGGLIRPAMAEPYGRPFTWISPRARSRC